MDNEIFTMGHPPVHANISTPLYIFDIDGTLADATHRLHWIKPESGMDHWESMEFKPNWEQFYRHCHLDLPKEEVIRVLLALAPVADIWFFTGRREEFRSSTVEWLNTYIDPDIVQDANLMMRPNGDHRKDFVVKEEMLNNMLIEDRFRLQGVFEDRKGVTEMFRRNDVLVFQVAEGNY